MATEKSLSGGNLGTVLDSYGGKLLKRILIVGAAIYGGAATISRSSFVGSTKGLPVRQRHVTRKKMAQRIVA